MNTTLENTVKEAQKMANAWNEPMSVCWYQNPVMRDPTFYILCARVAVDPIVTVRPL